MGENQNLVFDLEAAEVTTLGACKDEFLSWFAKDYTGVFPHEGASVDEVICALAVSGIQGPESDLFRPSHHELVFVGVPELDVFLEASPLDCCWGLGKVRGNQLQRGDNMA